MTEPSPLPPNDPALSATPPESDASVWEDFIDIFYTPASVFARRRLGQFGKAFLIFWVLATALVFAARPVMGPIIETQMEEAANKAMAANTKLTEEQKERAMSLQRKIAGFATTFGAVVGPPIGILLFAVGVWIVARIVGTSPSFGQSATIATYSSVPSLLGTVLLSAQGLMMDTANMKNLSQLSIGPARFMDPDAASPVALALATRFDVFSIWTAILIGIGVAIIGRTTRARGFTAGAIFWAIATLFAVFGALRQQASMG